MQEGWAVSVFLSAAVIAGAYLLGAIPSAYLLGRWKLGIDIRKYGTGNVGISNVATFVGKRVAAPLVPFDIFIKGMLPVVIASGKVLDLGLEVELAAGFAAIVGHNWPVWLKFNGGRGMATVLGVVAALYWPLVILYGSVAGIGWLLTRSSALWWGIAAVMMPVWSLILRQPIEVTLFAVGFLVVMAIKRLTSNRTTPGAPPGQEVGLLRLVWNRLAFDRDIASREEWVYRQPDA